MKVAYMHMVDLDYLEAWQGAHTHSKNTNFEMPRYKNFILNMDVSLRSLVSRLVPDFRDS